MGGGGREGFAGVPLRHTVGMTFASMRMRIALVACTGLFGLAVQAGAPAQAADPGKIDRSFGRDGRVLTDVFGKNDRATDLLVQRGGKLLVAGTAAWPTDTGPAHAPTLVRYRRDGRLDRSFSGDGRTRLKRYRPAGEPGVTKICGASNSKRASAALAPRQRILLASECRGELTVARFLSDGELDRSFGRRGSKTINLGPGLNHATDIALTKGARIVVAGFTRGAGGGDERLFIVRYRRDGRLDRSFADQGRVLTDFGTGTYVDALGLAVQDDSRLVVSGTVGNNWIVARFLEDGELDPSFSDDGIAYTAPALIGYATDVEIDRRGRIVACGTASGDGITVFGLARYLPDGSLDGRFGTAGTVRTPFGADRPSGAESLAIQRDGKIVLVGTSFGGPFEDAEQRFALARYRKSGRLDRRFGKNGRVISGFRRPSIETDFGQAAALQRDGRIIAAGSSYTEGNWDFGLIRYLGG